MTVSNDTSQEHKAWLKGKSLPLAFSKSSENITKWFAKISKKPRSSTAEADVSGIQALPVELLLDIAERLDKNNLCRLRLVNQHFHDIASQLLFPRMQIHLVPPESSFYCYRRTCRRYYQDSPPSNYDSTHISDDDFLRVKRVLLQRGYKSCGKCPLYTYPRVESGTASEDPLSGGDFMKRLRNSESGNFLSFARELVIRLPEFWLYVDADGYSNSLKKFTDECIAQLLDAMGRLREVRVHVQVFPEVADAILHFLLSLCELCGKRFVGVHINLLARGTPKQEDKSKGPTNPSLGGIFDNLLHLKSIFFRAHYHCKEETLYKSVTELVARSPGLKIPANFRQTVYIGRQLTFGYLGPPLGDEVPKPMAKFSDVSTMIWRSS